jgi:SAM-dependent methyltransferase
MSGAAVGPGRCRGVDVGRGAVAARVVDHALGGWHTFPADRLFAEHAELACPGFIHDVRAHRDFGQRAVRWMAAQGVRQFLDVGCGLPMNGATHETLAHLGVPGHVVYVDRDPVAVAFAQNLRPTPPGVTAIRGDLRDPDSILNHNEVRDRLDFGQPIAVLLFGVLAHVADSDQPDQIVARLRQALAPGSYLGLSHPVHQPLMRHEQRRLRLLYRATSTPLHHRIEDQLLQLLSGWDLVPPGLVPICHWRPDRPMAAAGARASVAGAVASVPEARMAASARSATANPGRSGRCVLPIDLTQSNAAAGLRRDVSLVPTRSTPHRQTECAGRAC